MQAENKPSLGAFTTGSRKWMNEGLEGRGQENNGKGEKKVYDRREVRGFCIFLEQVLCREWKRFVYGIQD